MKIAIEGCCHGELEKIYSTLEHLEKENDIKVDLLIICGDFQSVRNEKDLESMAVPEKYRELCSFWKYYAEVERAPVLTLFIGGNHEASNYLCELPYGGWVAPNIYYMGYANVVNFGGLRIAGLSGIYKAQDYYKGHFELPPLDSHTAHSIYHVRNLDVFRLSQLKREPRVDIMVTHDWPTDVYNHGNVDELVGVKPYFAQEIQTNSLGSPENERLLKLLRPRYWFSAHLHVKFAALYKHENETDVTRFLALDKCLPRRKFLQVVDIEPVGESLPKCLHLDTEWLAILKKTKDMLSVDRYNQAPISLAKTIEITQTDIDELKEDFQDSFEIPDNFKRTAPIHSSGESASASAVSASDEEESSNSAASKYNNDYYLNEQTTLLCEMLNIKDPIRVLLEKRGQTAVISDSTTQLYNKLLDEDDD